MLQVLIHGIFVLICDIYMFLFNWNSFDFLLWLLFCVMNNLNVFLKLETLVSFSSRLSFWFLMELCCILKIRSIKHHFLKCPWINEVKDVGNQGKTALGMNLWRMLDDEEASKRIWSIDHREWCTQKVRQHPLSEIWRQQN